MSVSPLMMARFTGSLGVLVAGGLLALTTGCGDIGAVRLVLDFPSEDSELRTEAIRTVIREGPETGFGCDDLWSDAPVSRRQSEGVTAYPSANDVLVAPVSLGYDRLSFFVYGHPGIETVSTVGADGEELSFQATGDPLVGGCVDWDVEDENATTTLEVTLILNPN